MRLTESEATKYMPDAKAKPGSLAYVQLAPKLHTILFVCIELDTYL